MSEFAVDVINISKIKEGFHVGDELAATNLDVIIQLKLTHMINTAGSQIINAWETIGIKYLTLNWSENPSQNLFDSKDEIANRIVLFIDDSSTKGEGLLIHSVRGQNRVCLVVLVYLMKKYKWSLIKSLEFLRSKKKDIDIPKYFLNQLTMFEQRMIKKGEEITNAPWQTDQAKDPDEKLMVNTYLNGLPNNPTIKDNPLFLNKRHINWADSNPYKKESLFSFNPAKDLFNQKEIKPVTTHKKLHSLKSCMKNKVNGQISDEDSELMTGFNQLNPKMVKFNNSVSINSKSNQSKLSSINESVQLTPTDYLFNYAKLYEEKKNENKSNSSVAHQQYRSNNNSNIQSNEQKASMIQTTMEAAKQKNIIGIMPITNTKSTELLSKEANGNKFVIMNNCEQIVNNSINNYFIQNTLGEIGQNMHKLNNKANTSYQSNSSLNSRITNQNHNNNISNSNSNTSTPMYFNNFVSNMKISNSEKHFNPIQLNKGDYSQMNNGINIKPISADTNFSDLNNINNAKITKQGDLQKNNKNAFLNNNNNQLNYNGNTEFKVKDYVNNNENNSYGSYIPLTKDNDLKQKGIDSMNLQQQQQQQQPNQGAITNLINFHQTKPLNNYNPTLNKKNCNSTGALFNRQQKPVPIK